MPLNNLFRKLNAVQTFDIQSESLKIITEYGYYITALIRLQLQQGKDANDENVKIFGRDFYSDRTIFDKEHGNYPPLGKQTEWITNYKTGAFYASLRTVVHGTTFGQESDVSYFEDIIERSGEVILRLNKEHILEFKEEILIPELRRRYKLLSGGI